MKGKFSVSCVAFFMLAVPAGAAAQTPLVQAKTSGGAEVATIRTDSMRVLVPVRVLGTGLRAGYLAADDSLRVGGEGSVLATGTYDGGLTPPPASGAGTRMMWYPELAAFRAGSVNSTQWNSANVGNYSVAFGEGTTASGSHSFAHGVYATASGLGAVAMGGYADAIATYSNAFGYSTGATGQFASVFGLGTLAQAYGSFVIGEYNLPAGTTDSWLAGDPLFVAGNGVNPSSPSNALTLYKNGDMTIAGTLTQSSDARLKEDMEPLKGTLAKVMQLTPIRYRFRPGTGRPGGEQIGLTAQQVRPLFPELVKQDADGYLSLSYANLSAVLVKAVQEQQAEIAPLQARIRTLQERNDQLASEVATLQAMKSEVARLKASQAEILRRLRTLKAGGGR